MKPSQAVVKLKNKNKKRKQQQKNCKRFFYMKNYVTANLLSVSRWSLGNSWSLPVEPWEWRSSSFLLKMLLRVVSFSRDRNLFLPRCGGCASFYPEGSEKVGFRFGPAETGDSLVTPWKTTGFWLFECRKPNYTLVNSLQSTKHRKKTVAESERPAERKESLRPNESKLNTSPQKCQTFLLAQNKA